MLPNRLVLILSAFVFSCGAGSQSTSDNTDSTPTSAPPDSFVAGASCQSNADCGSGFCGNWPGGYCGKQCHQNSDCGSGICVDFSDSSLCVAQCDFTANSCRNGYECKSLVDASFGFCGPIDNTPPKLPDGSACTAAADCAGGSCFGGAPGGYCTSICQSGADCHGNSVCMTTQTGEAICTARCDQPGSQSTCRDGYICQALQGVSFGSCLVDNGSQIMGGGSGGGAGGGSGSGGGSSTGGNPPSACRVYATKFTIVTTGGPVTITAQHTASFDPAALTLTDTWTDNTSSGGGNSVAHFASVADFVTQASSMIDGKGGPTSVAFANGTVETHVYDSLGRLQSLTSSRNGVTNVVTTYTAWDSAGRPTGGTQDFYATDSEKCLGRAVSVDLNDVTRTAVWSYSGGTNYSAYGLNNCLDDKTTEHFDTQFLLGNVIIAGPTMSQQTYTNSSTDTVCD
jgi:hypothetical protein